MKKKLAMVTMLLTTALAAAGCDSDEVTLKQNDGKSIIYTIKTDDGTTYYYADDLLEDLQDSSSATSSLYSEVSRQVFTQYAYNTLTDTKIAAIRTDAEDEVDEFKDDCKSSASDEGTDYDTYLENALSEEGVETTEELEELYFYQGLKSEILEDFVEDPDNNNAHYNYFLQKYLDNYTPYQVKHILVAANSADTNYKDGTMTADNARKLLTIMNRFIEGDSFEDIALLTDDTSSAQNGGVMPFNEAQNYVSEFRYATYVQEIFLNNTTLDDRYTEAAKLHLLSTDDTSDDYVSKEDFEDSNLYQVYQNGIRTVALSDIMALSNKIDNTVKGAYNYYSDVDTATLKDGITEDDLPTIAEQSYEMNVSKYNDEGDLNQKYYEEYELERNEIFNSTLNCHEVQYIEVDTSKYPNANVVDYNGKKVLSDEFGNPIFVALASTGIHFMAMVWNANNPYDASGNYTSPALTTEALESLSNIICDKQNYTIEDGATAYATATASAGDSFNQYLNEAYFTLFDDSKSDYTYYQYTYIGQHGDYKTKSTLQSNSDDLLSDISSYASNLEYYLFDAIVYQTDSKLDSSNFSVKFTLDNENISKTIKDYVQDKLTSTDDSFASSVKSSAETYADKLMREKDVKVAAGIWSE